MDQQENRCAEHARRLAVLEERMADLRDIKDCVVRIEKHIAVHSEALPRISSQILEITHTQHNQEKELVNLRISTAAEKSKTKLVFGALGTIGFFLLGIVAKLFFLI